MNLENIRFRSKKELSKIALESLKEAFGVINGVKEHDFSQSSVIVYAKDFKTECGFAYALGAIGKHYKDSDDIIVRYSKPENKETGEVMVCFEVLRSKAKVFLKWLKDRKEPLYFFITSVKEIKDSVKFLNSLGVKDDEGNGISNFVEEMKKHFDPTQNKILVDIRLYGDVPTIVWDYVGKLYECDVTYEMAKAEISGIFSK